MAHQQAYQAYPSNKGTLIPGKSITVNKYNVQVERYLSQGGFAHVYLVRTPTPVYNTTHHVLKRIAVANDAMLTEVKKEVDIMRILKGHPNIVHLIDAAWHRMPTGMYEVFILMEFCPGGGIIDMMNRRLRERLTESEILQIFVDVCEGVAAMHNLRPALLHRDLKVENILQSSPTSFKLCDFGSATPVAARPPSSNTEIRALEADLNRHTTLQYRAPEMVDPYLRRAIDEKSDVWALGVLLYKLCYYTTPFEEHGPLAILNVQYRTPPYPVYSSQMNSLIGSMLREHGAQRPSIFEVLSLVHKLRGTKSRFTYSIPSPQPLSPRHGTASPSAPASNPLDSLVSFRSSSSPGKSAGIEAREKVLEAIAPMRRGRPTASTPDVDTTAHILSNASSSRPSSPQKDRKGKHWVDDDAFEAEWQNVKTSQGAVKGFKSGGGSSAPDAWKVRSPASGGDDAWKIGGRTEKTKIPPTASGLGGFENDFGEKLWDSFDGRTPATSVTPSVSPPKMISTQSSSRLAPSKSKDAFDGLGLSDPTPAPTLAEARKLRTGLAVVQGHGYQAQQSQSRPASSRPTPSPRPSPIPPSVSPAWRPSPQGDLVAETRFPSLEELDATFSASPSPPAPLPHASSQPPPPPRPSVTGGLRLRPPGPHRLSTYGQDGVRSEQVTGIAMRDSKEDGLSKRHGLDEPIPSNSKPRVLGKERSGEVLSRPSLSRKHRSSISIKHRQQSGGGVDLLSPSEPISSPRPSVKPPPDWLTGDDDEAVKPPGTPVLRESPSKRASYIAGAESAEFQAASMKAQSVVVEREPESLPSPPEPTESVRSKRESVFASRSSRARPSVNAAQKAEITSPSETLTENWSPVAASFPQQIEKDSSSSSAEESPEDVNGFVPAVKETRRRKGRQSSVHDLVDLWGGGLSAKDKEKQTEPAWSGRVSNSPPKEKEREPLKSATSTSNDSNSGAPKRRSTVLGSASTTYTTTSPSPPRPLATPVNRSPKPQASGHRKQPSTGTASAKIASAASPGRSRPQSMFLFPVAKTNSDVSLLDVGAGSSPGLVPPPDPKPRTSRRTSISDMVQRYEAIGGGKGPAPPPIISKPMGLKVATQASHAGAMNGRAQLGATSPVATRGSEPTNSLPVPDDSMSGSGDPAKRRMSPSGLPPTSPLSQTDSGSNMTGLPSRGLSSYNFQTTSQEPSSLEPPNFPISSRKPTTPTEELSSQASPPSPERPYQGVGKLIDQWQRKAADTDSSRGAGDGSRGGFRTKRAGLVSGGGNRGH